uniref:NADH-ubiquinone oxidoreductase chain 6 n=1 Tax=Lithodesmium undulatum TaxID=59812 RepID=A0A7T6UZN2_LITUN|nr:NADH dehydrogenase subunit 6 [Lithodesmium undulatum]QQJ94637.1 NADH dehydrogenase subunit 6 [Lithodesmium undulatum]
MILNLLFYFFSILLLLSSLMIIIVQNSIYAVLFLVLSFISASSLLFLLEIEFIALIFIIIYVGAIAVLFLFVVMMLDIKTVNLTKDSFKYFPFGSFLGLIFFIEMFLVIFKTFKRSPYQFNTTFLNNYTNWFEKIDTLTDLEVIGQILYTHYIVQFLIAGFILLLSVIGAVILTIKTKTKQEKTQSIFKQLSRNYTNVLLD